MEFKFRLLSILISIPFLLLLLIIGCVESKPSVMPTEHPLYGQWQCISENCRDLTIIFMNTGNFRTASGSVVDGPKFRIIDDDTIEMYGDHPDAEWSQEREYHVEGDYLLFEDFDGIKRRYQRVYHDQ